MCATRPKKSTFPILIDHISKTVWIALYSLLSCIRIYYILYQKNFEQYLDSRSHLDRLQYVRRRPKKSTFPNLIDRTTRGNENKNRRNNYNILHTSFDRSLCQVWLIAFVSFIHSFISYVLPVNSYGYETAVMVAVIDVLCNSLMSEEHNI